MVVADARPRAARDPGIQRSAAGRPRSRRVSLPDLGDHGSARGRGQSAAQVHAQGVRQSDRAAGAAGLLGHPCAGRHDGRPSDALADQILSAEAHVPWELAVLPETIPLADANAPRYLGAQADIGRWVLGNPPPRVPPPGSLHVASIAAISGVYAGAANLEDAQAEAEALETSYHADPCTRPPSRCSRASPASPRMTSSTLPSTGTTAARRRVAGRSPPPPDPPRGWHGPRRSHGPRTRAVRRQPVRLPQRVPGRGRQPGPR